MSSNDLNAERTQFQIFCDKLGKKYAEDYGKICIDQAYNSAKTLAPKVDVHQYIQAASEQIFYYLLQKKFPNLEHDKKINPLNNTDVDIVSDQSNPALHIEVKTPRFFKIRKSMKKARSMDK